MDSFDGEAINTLELVEAGGRTTYQALVTWRPVYARAQAVSAASTS